MSKSTIELNGKRYDVRTGKIVGDAAQQPSSPVVIKPTNGAVLDGFTRRAPAAAAPQKTQKTALQSTTQPKTAARGIQKSQTLMRPAVKKPAAIKNDIQGSKRLPKPAHEDLARKARAEAAPKSPLISKFGAARHSNVTKKEAHLPVASPSQALSNVEQRANRELQRIEHAIAGATSHLNQLEKGVVKKARFLDRVGFRNRFANIATMACSVLLLGGFFAYQNVASVEMRVAAARSGVSAQMPSYKPAGYGVVGKVDSSAGKVTVSFKSRTDDKKFTVTQQSSNWNSTSLLANHVTKAQQPYQTYQNDGKTVYIFDNSNATWVNGGVWYQVVGDASLTSDQLLRLANSF